MAEVQLFVGRPQDVRERVGWDRIQALRFNYYMRVFGESWGEDAVHDYIRLTSTDSWDDPNAGARRSRRANPIAVVAHDLDERADVGLAYVADDASKTRRLPLGLVPGFIQEPLKLRSDRLVDKRWAWTREMLGDVAISAGMMKVALKKSHPAQPVSLYPYADEAALEHAAQTIGFEAETDERGLKTVETVTPLGADGPEVVMHRYTAPSASFVIHHATGLVQDCFRDTHFRVQHV